MGYEVYIKDADLTIPAANLDEALQRFKDLNKRDELKTGGSYSGGVQTERWFAWMPSDYDKTVTSAKEVIELLGFETTVLDNGDLRIDYYASKTGSEQHFFEAIADLVNEGYINWVGEDGEHFRWAFDGLVLLEQQGRIVYG